MKKNIGILTGTFFLAFILTAHTGFAQPRRGTFQHRQGVMLPAARDSVIHQPRQFMAGRLDLTEDQQRKIEVLRKDHLKKVLPLRNKMGELKAQYRTLITAETPDQKAVDKNIDAQTTLLNQLMKARADFNLRFRKVLTEDQRLILDANWGQGRMMGGPAGRQGRMPRRAIGSWGKQGMGPGSGFPQRERGFRR